MENDVRAELLREFREAAQDTVIEWCRRWQTESGDSIKATYMDDRTVEIERETAVGFDRVRVKYAVAVIDATEPNKPTGFVMTRPWNLVPVGWFVKTPKGEWFEIVATVLLEEKQEVSMKGPDGKRIGPFPRDPNGEVLVRRGTHDKELDDAIEALSDVFGGTSIIRDGDWS